MLLLRFWIQVARPWARGRMRHIECPWSTEISATLDDTKRVGRPGTALVPPAAPAKP